MAKPTIFLSHITQERHLADLFRAEIEANFLGMVNVFQSSDPSSLPLGQNWLNNITNALRNCEAILLFCSPESVRRPWINFECGAGWARNIEVAPLCHSGLRAVDLPVPISLLQGIQASDAARLEQVFSMIAGKLGSAVPKFDASRLARNVASFEARYIEEAVIVANLKMLEKDLVITLAQVKPGIVTPIGSVPGFMHERGRVALAALQKAGLLDFSWKSEGIGFGDNFSGEIGTLTVQVTSALAAGVAKFLQDG